MSNKLPLDIQCCLYNVKKPYQYIGDEYLSYNKDFDSAKAKIALMFPDKYEIAISNLGQKVLYDFVNADERFMADRNSAQQIRRLIDELEDKCAFSPEAVAIAEKIRKAVDEITE